MAAAMAQQDLTSKNPIVLQEPSSTKLVVPACCLRAACLISFDRLAAGKWAVLHCSSCRGFVSVKWDWSNAVFDWPPQKAAAAAADALVQGLDRAQTQAAEQITIHLSHCSDPIAIKQNPTALKGAKIRVGAAVWDGAYVLASYLDAQPQGAFTGLRCVELGCGCGLLGLLLARLGAAAVYLTDKPQHIVGPRVNAAKNKLLAPAAPARAAAAAGSAAAGQDANGAQQAQAHAQVQVQQQQASAAVVQVVGLDWEDQQSLAQSVAAIRAQGDVDLIVASDCIYPGRPAVRETIPCCLVKGN